MDTIAAIRSRRSVRRFAPRAVDAEVLRELVADACTAPAPHHTRPWRFAVLCDAAPKDRLAQAMGEAWRRDMAADGVDPAVQDRLVERSVRRIHDAPAVILAGLVDDGLRAWPDARRRGSEWAMAQHSLGCALQNIMLGAHARGLASYWISAPLFCQDAVRLALDLPEGWQPQALVVVGWPSPDYEPRRRAALDLSQLLIFR